MIRIAFILCGFGCFVNTGVLNAQNLPKYSFPQQTIGDQLQQQKAWQLRQLPENSVLYRFEQQRAKNISYSFHLKKQKAASFNVLLANPAALSSTSLLVHNPPSLLQSQLWQQNKQYRLWKKNNWWKDPRQGKGSLWLREFLINSKNKENFRL